MASLNPDRLSHPPDSDPSRRRPDESADAYAARLRLAMPHLRDDHRRTARIRVATMAISESATMSALDWLDEDPEFEDGVGIWGRVRTVFRLVIHGQVLAATEELQGVLDWLPDGQAKVELALLLPMLTEQARGHWFIIPIYERWADLVRLYGDLEQRGRYSNNLGYALLIAERHHEALVQFRRAIALRSQPGLGLNLASSLVNLGLVLRLLGDWQGSLETLELAITQCRRTPGQTQMRVCLANFAWVQARGGDFDGALATLAKAEEHAPPAAYRSWRGV
jgi:tetratricopeptide (TPR) repeat protein